MDRGDGKSEEKSAEKFKAIVRETNSHTEMYSRYRYMYKHYEQRCFRQAMINGAQTILFIDAGPHASMSQKDV